MFILITLKGNVLLVFERLDDVLVLELTEHLKFIFQMPLLLLEARGDHLESDLIVTLSEDIYIGVAATSYLFQFVLLHSHKVKKII